MLGMNILMKKSNNDAFKAAACEMPYVEKKNIEPASRIPRSLIEIGSSDFTNIIALVPMKACIRLI